MFVLFVTCPPEAAPDLVRQLVEERLVGCGNILPGVRSIYRWHGSVEDDAEAVLLMETAADRVDSAMARISELHPYDVPKIVALEPARVNEAYLGWLQGVTRLD